LSVVIVIPVAVESSTYLLSLYPKQEVTKVGRSNPFHDQFWSGRDQRIAFPTTLRQIQKLKTPQTPPFPPEARRPILVSLASAIAALVCLGLCAAGHGAACVRHRQPYRSSANNHINLCGRDT